MYHVITEARTAKQHKKTISIPASTVAGKLKAKDKHISKHFSNIKKI